MKSIRIINEADELDNFRPAEDELIADLQVDELLSDSFTAEEIQAVNEMERIALDKNNNESAPLSTQDT